MAPLDPRNTPRAFLSYQCNGAVHTMMVRVAAAETDANISENVAAFLEAMGPILISSQFLKFERTDEGSNVRVPAVWTGPTEWGTGSGDTDERPFFYSFTGKDVAGHKARVDIYGAQHGVGDPWRIAEADSSNVTDALAALRTTDAVFNSIGGAGVIWNNYANKSVSQHWVKKVRRG